MPEPRTPTPLSEAVARLTRAVDGEYVACPSVTYRERDLAADIRTLLDAVAEGREDSKIVEFVERNVRHVEVVDPPSGDAWVWCVTYYDSSDATENDVLSEQQEGSFRGAIRAAVAHAESPPPAPTEPGQ